MTDPVTGLLEAERTAVRPIVCLHPTPGAADWFDQQHEDLDVIAWETPGDLALDATDPGSVDRWVEGAVTAVTSRGEGPVHVLATGAAAYGAIVLASRHPELVVSLLLGDPELAHAAGAETERADLLRSIVAPTLVIASAPDPGHGTADAQALAGGIDNGVFVIIDGCRVPAHRERGSSFNEWVSSFTIIAEGLMALAPQRQEDINA
ncbi:alpha/beta fold hydrolase [Nocardioides sp. Root151]|uniref:alpha/beta fold hydrolase n=1 Tax=Nocardioides sp. Root151 TaxID=1736475 RepID=UPI000A54F2F3|nr:alpha/beta hydrolase [Nocardioides sp. Root151]